MKNNLSFSLKQGALLFLFLLIGVLLSIMSCQSPNIPSKLKRDLSNESSLEPLKNYPAHWWKHFEGPKPSWEILPDEAKEGEVILSKRNELGILSNFTLAPFVFHKIQYQSIEGFWQMMLYPESSTDPRAFPKKPGVVWEFSREAVSKMVAFEAKTAGEKASKNLKILGFDWVSFEGRRFKYFSLERGEHYKLIREAMCEKLKQNSNVREILLSTGDLILRPDHHQEEVAPDEWRYFKIWMEMRSQLQSLLKSSKAPVIHCENF